MRSCIVYADITHNGRLNMHKEKRQKAILNLVSRQRVANQSELAQLLSSQGFSVNQSSVSRDLLELNITKLNGAYATVTNENSEVLSIGIAGNNLVIVKTEAGMASAICVKIDRENFKEIAGTIAGEDTIFVAVKDEKLQKEVIKLIWKLFERGTHS